MQIQTFREIGFGYQTIVTDFPEDGESLSAYLFYQPVKLVQHFDKVFPRWKFRSLIHYAVDQRKSNIEFDDVPLRQILTKCCKIKQTYDVLCAKQTRKIRCKHTLALHRYRDFRVGFFFNFDSPCMQIAKFAVLTGEIGETSDHFLIVETVDVYARGRWFEHTNAERTALYVLLTVHYPYLPVT